MTSYLVTHSGGFHADELLSSVVLTRLFPDAEIIRTRAPDWIAPAADRIVYDVGQAYDADARIFDHHQRGAPLREDGQPYSSFGLVWKHFGIAYLTAFGVPETDAPRVHATVDRSFVLPIDLVDNGAYDLSQTGPMAGMMLSGLLESLKPVFDNDEPSAERDAFDAALVVARAFLEAKVRQAASKLRAEGQVMDAIAAAGDARILELPRGMPFRPSVVKAGADHLLFVIHPRGGDWTLTGIRKDNEGFAQRADLPAAWAGLTGAALEQASGVAGATFCHNGRFIAAASTRDAIVAMANIAVAEAVALENTKP